MLKFVSSSDHIKFSAIKRTHYHFLKSNDYIECFDSMHQAISNCLHALSDSSLNQKLHLSESIDISERDLNKTTISFYIVFFGAILAFGLKYFPLDIPIVFLILLCTVTIIDLVLRESGRERSSNRTYFKLVAAIAKEIIKTRSDDTLKIESGSNAICAQDMDKLTDEDISAVKLIIEGLKAKHKE